MKRQITLFIMMIAWQISPADEMIMDHSKMNHATMQHSSPPNSSQENSLPLRNPDAFADGYLLSDLPFHAAHSDANRAALIVDRLESMTTSQNISMTYDLQAWFGKTYNRALLRAEGDMQQGKSQNARTELLWSHALTPFWDTHLGMRYDSGAGLNRGWLAFGIQGLAPYWLYVEATGYLNEQGRTAFRLELEYDLLITQRLILQPRLEANFYGKNDLAHHLGNGLSNLEMGLRLRYEFRPEFAPYIGIDWTSLVGNTRNDAELNGKRIAETRFVAGVHFWF